MSILDAVLDPLARTVLAWLSRRRLPQVDGTLRLAGLAGPVEVIRDSWGVPHIYATDWRDLMFAQGFVHAQDRLWQMDFHRRLVAGRLSEVLGVETLPVDRWVRILGMRRVAEKEVCLLTSRTRASVEAYADGINARIGRGRLPIEFTLLRYEPEPWTVADTLSWNKMMSWMLSVNWETELLRAQLIDQLGPEHASELEPEYSDRCPLIVPPGVDCSCIGGAALSRAEAARAHTGPSASASAGLGSNSWVLSGSRTSTGAPLLANDMHLSMGMPSIWYENHLIAGDVNASGITFPGVPSIVVGHNGHVAWGFTNGFPDVQDLYVEHIRRTDGGSVEYEFRGQWLAAEVIREEIEVKGAETAVEEVVITRHGPIINSLAPDLADEHPLALRWVSLEPDTMIESFFEMVQARNCIEFRDALRHWSAPTQHIVYADTGGNIAYSFPGKIPIRAKGDGRVPAPGWTGEYEWIGWVPFEELPHLFNPPQGYIATANNRVTGDEYPYFLGYDHCAGDRAQRIVELIEEQASVDVQYVKRMQFDLVSATARVVKRYLGDLPTPDGQLAAVTQMMREWDGTLAADSAAAAVYEVFMRRIVRLTLSHRLGALAINYAGKGPTPLLASRTMLGHRSWEWVQSTLADPSSHWFDLGQGETRDDLMRLALDETVDFLRAELGPQIDDWAWGKLHTLTYGHLLGRVSPLDRVFNRGPYPMGGDDRTLWATGANTHDLACDTVVGPPFRSIVDLGDLRNSQGLLAPGQSGQVGSKHYDDQGQAWFEAEYHPMLYSREDVEREAESRLRLTPAET